MENALAGHTNSYHTYGGDEALAGIAEAGYTHVELSAVPGWTEHVDLDADPGELRSKLENYGLDARQPERPLRPHDSRRARARDQGRSLGGRLRHPDRQHGGRGAPERGRERAGVPTEHRRARRRRRVSGRRRRARDPRRHHGLERGHRPAAGEDRARVGQGQLRHGQRRVLLGQEGGRRPARDHELARPRPPQGHLGGQGELGLRRGRLGCRRLRAGARDPRAGGLHRSVLGRDRVPGRAVAAARGSDGEHAQLARAPERPRSLS